MKFVTLSSSLLTLLVVFHQCCGQDINVTLSDGSRDVANGDDDEIAKTASDLSASEREVSVNIGHDACRLSTFDPYVHNFVTQLVRDKASLIEYRLNFTNYTTNPLTTSDVMSAYRADRWARVTTAHGQTLLSLAFNYGVLSMSTLTLGTEVINVELVDSPPGCFGLSNENQKVAAVQYLLMHDFDANGPLKTVDDARVCHEVILDDNGYAQFRHNCCYVSTINKHEECTTDIGNIWLDLLYAMLAIVRFGLLLFSPVMFIGAVASMSKDNIPYVVRLKDKLIKTVWICRANNAPPSYLRAERTLNLRTATGFPELLKKVKKLANSGSLQKKLTVCFDRYDITVDYKRMLKENTVPVGLLQTLFRTLIKCRVRHTGPFKECCKTNIFSTPPRRDGGDEENNYTGVTWSSCCRQLSKLLLVLLIPFPFYIRLGLFYVFEEAELLTRKEATEARGLNERYDNSVIHYFTPSHWFFITMYVIYAMTGFALAFFSKRGDESYRPKTVIVNSFRDLKTLNWTDVLSMAVSNMIWPLKRFGIYGVVVGIIYWPLALLYTSLICIGYLLPTIYLSFRMAYYARTAIFVKERLSQSKMYQVRLRLDKDMYKMKTETCIDKPNQDDCLPYPQGRADPTAPEDDVDFIEIDHIKRGNRPANKSNEKPKITEADKDAVDGMTVDIEKQATATEAERFVDNDEDEEDAQSSKSAIRCYQKRYWRRAVENILSAFLGILTLYSCVIILSEVIGSFVEIMTFTIMGIIVNANALLKYAILLLMIFVYCCDCFNNVTKKYLKMNKALFNEVTSRISNDLKDETGRPAHLQENRGFKAQELTQQADFELPDDIAEKVPRHWMINDLVMFVDSEDMPRIPRKLFEMVCNIRVAGVPGPVYRGHIEAMTQLIKIILFVCFVFIIVLSFGAVYKVSSTNQMLATLLGGFLPMVLRTFLAPPAPDVELGTVSFKSKMDEIIKNFCQYWPIHDLPFELVTESKDDKKTDEPAAKEAMKDEKSPMDNNNDSEKPADKDVVDGGASAVAAFGTVNVVPNDLSSMLSSVAQSKVATTSASNYVPDPKPQNDESAKKDVKPVAAASDAASAEQDANKVDLIIYLPQVDFDKGWLPEWSQYDFDPIEKETAT